MKTLTLSAKAANALRNFYGELIKNFYSEVKAAVPELGVRAPFRLEGVIDAIAAVLEPLSERERELRKAYDEASDDDKKTMLATFREIADTELTAEMSDDRFDLARTVFEKLGDSEIWPKKVNKSTDPEAPQFEIVKVKYFDGSTWLEVGRAFGFDK